MGVPRVDPMPDAGKEAAPVGLDGHPPSAAVAALAAGEFRVDGFGGDVADPPARR